MPIFGWHPTDESLYLFRVAELSPNLLDNGKRIVEGGSILKQPSKAEEQPDLLLVSDLSARELAHPTANMGGIDRGCGYRPNTDDLAVWRWLYEFDGLFERKPFKSKPVRDLGSGQSNSFANECRWNGPFDKFGHGLMGTPFTAPSAMKN